MTRTREEALEVIRSNIDKTYMIRPASKGWGVYMPLDINRAELIYSSIDQDDCRSLLREADAKYV